MENDVVIKLATGEMLEACYRIRAEVFINEQKVPENMERDEDDAKALHFIALKGDQPVGTARVLLKENGDVAKIGRVAVVKSSRGQGLGKLLMQGMEMARELGGVKWFALNAQTHAARFYENIGYQADGEEFLDADIPHFHMKKPAAF